MGQTISMSSEQVKPRVISQVADSLKRDGVAVVPTDSSYALVCQIGSPSAIARLRALRSLNHKHLFTLMCANLSELSSYAEVGNSQYRFLKAHTPGCYTFILPATKSVPKKLLHPKRRSIGLRVPKHKLIQALLDQLGSGIIGVSLQPDDVDDDEMAALEQVRSHVDYVIDSGYLGGKTTVVDLTAQSPMTVREGNGIIDWD